MIASSIAGWLLPSSCRGARAAGGGEVSGRRASRGCCTERSSCCCPAHPNPHPAPTSTALPHALQHTPRRPCFPRNAPPASAAAAPAAAAPWPAAPGIGASCAAPPAGRPAPRRRRHLAGGSEMGTGVHNATVCVAVRAPAGSRQGRQATSQGPPTLTATCRHVAKHVERLVRHRRGLLLLLLRACGGRRAHGGACSGGAWRLHACGRGQGQSGRMSKLAPCGPDAPLTSPHPVPPPPRQPITAHVSLQWRATQRAQQRILPAGGEGGAAHNPAGWLLDKPPQLNPALACGDASHEVLHRALGVVEGGAHGAHHLLPLKAHLHDLKHTHTNKQTGKPRAW